MLLRSLGFNSSGANDVKFSYAELINPANGYTNNFKISQSLSKQRVLFEYVDRTHLGSGEQNRHTPGVEHKDCSPKLSLYSSKPDQYLPFTRSVPAYNVSHFPYNLKTNSCSSKATQLALISTKPQHVRCRSAAQANFIYSERIILQPVESELYSTGSLVHGFSRDINKHRSN